MMRIVDHAVDVPLNRAAPRVFKARSDTDRFQYAHDRDSNRLYRDNLLDKPHG